MSWLTPPPLIEKPLPTVPDMAKPSPAFLVLTIGTAVAAFTLFGVGLSFFLYWIGGMQTGILMKLLRSPFIIYGLPVLFLALGVLFGVQSVTMVLLKKGREGSDSV